MSLHYQLTVLENGLRVITEDMPTVRSVAVGCWVNTGSRDENQPHEAGASHFLEHLLFKGTEDIPASEISQTFDGMGADYNAYTSKDHTLYWARLVDEDLPEAFRLLAEVIQRPALRQEDIALERDVVFGEMGMREDDPGQLAHEAFVETFYDGHPLAPRVIGTRKAVAEMGRVTLNAYWRRRYKPRSVVVAAAGNVSHSDVVALARKHFGGWEDRGEVSRQLSDNKVVGGVSVREKDTENIHLLVGGEGLAQGDDQRWAMHVLNAALGVGMSSRLFTNIREKKGLAYAIGSGHHSFTEAGDWSVGANAHPSNIPEIISLIRLELNQLMKEGITDDELKRARGGTRGQLALHMESTYGRMAEIGSTELSDIEHLSADEMLDRIVAVDNSQIIEVARRLFSGPKTVVAAGPTRAVNLLNLPRE